MARNTVRAAAEKGRHIEFWALDRRSNCPEDNTGIASGDTGRAVDHYYGGREVNGRTFSGFVTSDQAGRRVEAGLEQTVRGQYDPPAAELPDQRLRKQKALCGRHSPGGVLTGVFATWDFDGNSATTADAGYTQCAGHFAPDTTISTSLDDLRCDNGDITGRPLRDHPHHHGPAPRLPGGPVGW